MTLHPNGHSGPQQHFSSFRCGSPLRGGSLRHRLFAAAAAIALSVALSAALDAGNVSAQQAPAQPDVQQQHIRDIQQPAQGDDRAKQLLDQPAPIDHGPKGPHSPGPERAGEVEPSAIVQSAEQAPLGVFENGVLTVPGAPRNAQSAPAKFSPRKAANDARPIMSGGAGLTDAQAAEVYRAVMAEKADNAGKAEQAAQPLVADAKPSTALPNLTPARRWPKALVERFPGLSPYVYVKAKDKVLIVTPASRIVVGWIGPQGQDPLATLGLPDDRQGG